MSASNWSWERSSTCRNRNKNTFVDFVLSKMLLRNQFSLQFSLVIIHILECVRNANGRLLPLLYPHNEHRCNQLPSFDWNFNTINEHVRRELLVSSLEDWLSACDCSVNPSWMEQRRYTLLSHSCMVAASRHSTIWALTGLHSNDDVNYRLASYFKSRYTIHFQQGSNRFGGVCLAVAREVPHRVAIDFKSFNNLIAVDVFNTNKKYTVAVMYSPPSEEVPIDLLNRLHRYNQNLILIGDLNARHTNWHDVINNSSGRRLADWIEKQPNLKIFNPSQSTSLRSQAVIDLIIAPSHVSSDLAVVHQKMGVSDHYPMHWCLSSFKSTTVAPLTAKWKKVDWNVVNCILDLKQNFFFLLAAQMKSDLVDFIRVYEDFLVALQERCTTYSRIRNYRPSLPRYLVATIKERQRILCLYRWTRSEEHLTSLRALNKYIHHELRAVKRAQWQEFCLGLEPKNTRSFWNRSKKICKTREHRIQGFVDEITHQVITDTDAMLAHA